MGLSGFGSSTGFHPLWGYLLGIAFRMAGSILPDGISAPLPVMLIVLTVNAFAFVLINYNSLRTLCGNRFWSTVLTLILYGFCWRYLFDGMESGILLLLLAISLSAAIHRKPFVLGMAAALMVWARIDALIFASIFYLLYSLNIYSGGKEEVKRTASNLGWRGGALQAMYLLLPVIISLKLRSVLFSSQISENVKFYWFALDMMRVAENMVGLSAYFQRTLVGMLWGFGSMMDPIVTAFDPSYGYSSDPSGVELKSALFIIFVLGFILLVFYRFRKTGKTGLRVGYISVACFAVVIALTYLGIVRFFNFYRLGWNWYLTAPVYAGIIAGILILLGLPQGMGTRRRLPGITVFVLLGLLVLGNVRFIQGVLTPKMSEWRSVYQEMVAAMDTLSLAPDEAVGTWAAGQISYYSRHRIVNLEGLAETPDLLKAQLTDDIVPVILSYKIRYIATKSTPEAIRSTIQRANSGVPKWKTDIRDRVFKDLEWDPVIVNTDVRLRSPFCIVRVSPLSGNQSGVIPRRE